MRRGWDGASNPPHIDPSEQARLNLRRRHRGLLPTRVALTAFVAVSVIAGLLGFTAVGTARASSFVCVQDDGSLSLPDDLVETTDAVVDAEHEAPEPAVETTSLASEPSTSAPGEPVDDDGVVTPDSDTPVEADDAATDTSDLTTAASASTSVPDASPAEPAASGAVSDAEITSDTTAIDDPAGSQAIEDTAPEQTDAEDPATVQDDPDATAPEPAGTDESADPSPTDPPAVVETTSVSTGDATDADTVDSNDLLSIASQMDTAAVAPCDQLDDDATMLLDGLSEEDLMLSIASLVEDETPAYASTPAGPRTYGILIQRPTVGTRSTTTTAIDAAPTTSTTTQDISTDLVVASADDDEAQPSPVVTADVAAAATTTTPSPTVEVAPPTTQPPVLSRVAPATTAVRPVTRPRPAPTVRSTLPVATTSTAAPVSSTTPPTAAPAAELAATPPTTTAPVTTTTAAELAQVVSQPVAEPQQIDLRKIFAQPRVGDADEVAIDIPNSFDQFGTIEFRPNRGRLGAVWILWMLATITIIGLWIPAPIRHRPATLNSSIPRHRR